MVSQKIPDELLEKERVENSVIILCPPFWSLQVSSQGILTKRTSSIKTKLSGQGRPHIKEIVQGYLINVGKEA